MENNALPQIKRGLEAIEIEHEGKPMVLLRDQEGIVKKSLAVSLPGFMIATLLNGQNTFSDVQKAVMDNTGMLVKESEVMNLVNQLEKANLIESEALHKLRAQVLKEFAESPVRKPFHNGGGYPEDTLELAAFFGKFFQDPKGPGKQIPSDPKGPPPLGLFVPHIDYHRGGPAYAWAYQKLGETTKPDTVVAFGVAHVSPNSPYVFLNKSYDTPYKGVSVDGGLYKELAKCLWYDVEIDKWTHRTEHSLEFQAVWLKYLWRDNTPPWVPILCSSFIPFCSDRPPSSVKSIEDGIQSMIAVLKARQEKGEKILILAGVDMAHVGRRFGDDLDITPELKSKIEKEDRDSLALALDLDADAFFMSVVKDKEWRKWCGLSAMYTSLRLIKGLSSGASVKGELLTYGQEPDPMGGIVSFSSIIFPRAM